MARYELRLRSVETKSESYPEGSETEPVIDYEAEKPVINIVDNKPVSDPTKYQVAITLGLRHVDGVGADFSKQIFVISNNSQTGYQVDQQRKQAIENYLIDINK